MLLFKRQFVDLVLSGRKTQTRRFHKSLRHVGSIQACKYEFLGKPFCYVLIIRCFKQRLGDISDAEAAKEGFSCREDFLNFNGFRAEQDKIAVVYEFKVCT